MGKKEYREREGPRRRKKKKSHRVYAAVVLVLGLAIIAAILFLLFYVQKIEVSGNDYVTEQEILETVQEDEFSINALYILGKYALGKVSVKEKPIVGYIQNGDTYSYFDKEGLVVLESPSLIEGIPYIEGIGMGEVKLYQHLESKNKKIFQQILETSREITKYELDPDRIVCEEDVICLYIGRIRIRLGKNVSAVKIAQIQPILEKIGDKEGTLHLENYSEVRKTVTFQEEPLAQESQEGTGEPDGGQSQDGSGEPETEDEGTPETSDALAETSD